MRRLSLLLVVICAGAVGIAMLAPGTQASRTRTAMLAPVTHASRLRITMSPAVARLVQQLLNHAPPATSPGSRIAPELRPVPGRRLTPQLLLPHGYSCEVASGSCSLKPCIKFAGAVLSFQIGTVQTVSPSVQAVAPPGNSGCRSAPPTVPAALRAASPQARPTGLLPAS